VKDIRRGASSDPWNLTALGRRVFFTADDGTHGEEPWMSNGTGAGTRLVDDVEPGRVGSSPYYLTRVGRSVYFFTDQSQVHGETLWKTVP
jgi:ELWxxDGT repeat protein